MREQMKAIQKELGDKEGKTGEIAELTEKIENAGMPEHVQPTALKELDRYEKVPSSSARKCSYPQLYRMACHIAMVKGNR